MLSGEIPLPPFFDDHVHAREPGNNKSETIESASIAAADGGVGGFNDMSNNAPQPTCTKLAHDYKLNRAAETSVVAYGAAVGAQPEYDNRGELRITLPNADEVKMYGGPTTNIIRKNDYEASEFDDNLDEIAMTAPDKLVAFHSGEENYRDFMGHAAGDRGLRVQLTHVNKRDQVAAVMEAQARGWDVEASICPHTMLLTDRDRMTRSSTVDMQPPLMPAEEADFLFWAFKNGLIRGLATDHAPHPMEKKIEVAEKNPTCSPDGPRCCGVPGLELASKVMLWLVHTDQLPMERLIDAYSTYPTENLRVSFAPNSKVIWDMKPFRIDDESKYVKSSCGWTPYLGMMAMGTVKEMRLSGKVVYRNNQVINPAKKVVRGQGEII